MSEVKRYDMCGFEGGLVECKDGAWYHMDDFDRVTAERDALRLALEQSGDLKNELQQRLTAADERAAAAKALITRILFCSEHQPSIATGYLHDILAALKPAEANPQAQRHECSSCNGKGLRVMGGELTECPACDGEGFKP